MRGAVVPAAAAAAAAAVVLSGAALPEAASAAQDPSLATITSPASDAVAPMGPELDVRLATKQGVTVTEVVLNGRAISPAIGARQNGSRTITVKASGGLVGGRNVLGISTRGPKGDTDFDQSAFWFASAQPSLLTLGAPQDGSTHPSQPTPTAIKTRVPVQQFRAWLNGKEVTSAYSDPDSANRRRATLGALDGLNQGQNKLTVEAVRGNFFSRQSTTFPTDGTCPLTSAGEDQAIQAGLPIDLQGQGLQLIQPQGDPLRYSWSVVRRPSKSAATLENATSAQPTLSTDVPGRYILNLRTTQDGCTSLPASVTVNAFPQVAVPTSTVAKQGDEYGILLGSSFIKNPGGSNPQIQVQVVNRKTLEPVGGTTGLTPGDAGLTQLENIIDGADSSQTVIISAPPGATLFTVAELTEKSKGSERRKKWKDAIKKIGSPLTPYELSATDPKGLAGPFSIIGISGLPLGTSYNIYTPGNNPSGTLQGNMVLDAQANYAFAFDDFPAFDTEASDSGSTTPNTISVAGSKYEATALGAGEGGFQVVVLDEWTLDLVSNTTFATKSASSADALESMSDTLSAVNANQGRLVFIVSVGSPAPTDFGGGVDDQWKDVADQVEKLGGTKDVFLRLSGPDTYSLVGYANAAPGAEASSAIPTVASGRQVGVLNRNVGGQFRPSAATAPGTGLNYELAQIAYQKTTPWPHSTSAGDKAANAYIAKELGLDGDDVRANYVNTADPFGGALLTKLKGLTYPGGSPGFTEDEFNALKTSLEAEFGWVEETKNYLIRQGGLQTPFIESTSSAYVDLESVASTVSKSVEPSDSKTAGTVLSVISDALSAVSKFDPELAPVGAIGSVFSAGAALANLPDGSPSATVDAKATELGTELEKSLTVHIDAINALYSVVVSDYGKLMAVGTKVTGDPSWAWTSTTSSQAVTRINQSATQNFYGALMPLAYSATKISYPGNESSEKQYEWARKNSAKDVTCERSTESFINPWEKEPTGGQALITEKISSKGNVDGHIWALGVGKPGGGFSGTLKTPPTSLTKPLFESLETSGGIGLYKPWFFTRNWSPRSFSCDPPVARP